MYAYVYINIYMHVAMGCIVSPQNFYIPALPLVPRHVTLFGNRVTADVTKMSLYWSGVVPLTPYDRCLYKKEKFVHRQADRQTVRCYVKMKAEIRVMLLTSQRATETVNKTPKTWGKASERTNLTETSISNSGLQNESQEKTFCCVSHSVHGTFFTAALGN